jgi:hypothetical protein
MAEYQTRRFRVKMKAEYIDVFQDRNRWAKLSNDDVRLLRDQLGPIIPAEEVHESARRFDLLVLKLRIARLLALARWTWTTSAPQSGICSSTLPRSSRFRPTLKRPLSVCVEPEKQAAAA